MIYNFNIRCEKCGKKAVVNDNHIQCRYCGYTTDTDIALEELQESKQKKIDFCKSPQGKRKMMKERLGLI